MMPPMQDPKASLPPLPIPQVTYPTLYANDKPRPEAGSFNAAQLQDYALAERERLAVFFETSWDAVGKEIAAAIRGQTIGAECP